MSDFVNTVDSVGDEALTNSIIDRSITEIRDNCVTRIGDSAFYSCSALTAADFHAATIIENSAFRSCSKLTTANFPAATSIGDYAFESCSALTTSNFPAATSIGNSAFQYCSALTTADFPAATKIGRSAFQYCSKLNTLILRYRTMAKLYDTKAFSNTPISSGTGYIYVPADLVDSYKADSKWSTYSNQVRAIEDYPEICGGETA